MKKTNITSNQEEIKMRKLIVEAPELKPGQKYSSGGIRENGPISVQYKNPIPYTEPSLPPTISQNSSNTENILKDAAKEILVNICQDLLYMFWYEYGQPFLKAKLRQLSHKKIAHIEEAGYNYCSNSNTYEPENIETDYINIQEISDIEESEKIIKFPNKNVS